MSKINSLQVRFEKVVRFATVNTHIECDDSQKITIMQGGVEVRGYPVYKGAVWFTDGSGHHYVSFTNKSTKLWKMFREAKPFSLHTMQANVKEQREACEHNGEQLPERTVVTHIKMS